MTYPDDEDDMIHSANRTIPAASLAVARVAIAFAVTVVAGLLLWIF